MAGLAIRTTGVLDSRPMRRRSASGPGSDSLQQTEAFWRRHVDMGVGSFELGAVALLVYLLLTPRGPHRADLEVITGAAMVLWITVFAPFGRWVISTRFRRPFLSAWSLATLAVIATAVGLDGGARSPLGVMLVLPVLFAALVYPPFDVAVLAALAVVSFSVLVLLQPSQGASRSLVTGAMLALAGGISVMASINRFVQERSARRLAERLHYLATRDGLSGCLSYLAFRRALDLEVARCRRYGRRFSLVMADLDNFKTVNDTYGHDIGDRVLRQVAEALRAGARSADVVGRVGGDEFAVLAPETGPVGAEEVARRLQDQVRASSLPVEVTVSYGTATWIGKTDDLESVVRRADRALYAAKHGGRDRLVVWENDASPR